MSSTVTGDFNPSHHQLTLNHSQSPNPTQHIPQLPPKTSISQPNAPSLKSKRRKSKPVRFEIAPTDVQTEHSSPSTKSVVSDPSSPCKSLRKEKSPKVSKTLVPSSPAMIRALEVNSSLGDEFPSCIKIMVKSQVICGFWMGLPLHFCESYLPNSGIFVLEDENGEQWEVKYIAYKSGISAGWKKFAIGHNLMEGDVLIFQLVETTKLKVYIFKANDSSEVDGALSLMNLEAHRKQITPVAPSPKTKKNTHPEPLSLTGVQKKQKRSSPSSRSIPPSQVSGHRIELSGSKNTHPDVETSTLSPKTKKTTHPESLSLAVVQKKQNSSPSSRSIPPSQVSGHRIEHSGNNSEEVGSELLEGSRPSKSNLLFEEVKTFEDFHIVVKGLCIDCELPDDVRTGYYKLCFSSKQFLHDSLPKGLYHKLVAGMIGETVTIANEIKNCRFTTTKEDLEAWDNSLKSFELLGMKVGFLRNRIRALSRFLFESEGALEIKRYVEAKNEQQVVDDEIQTVTAKLRELKVKAKKLEGISRSLKPIAENYSHKFKEELDAPW